MKIIQLSPGLIEIPPKGWGAIEEVIWNYKIELEKFGHSVEIIDYWGFVKKYEDGYRDFDIVHIHVSDQTVYFIKNNIPYFFTIHDIHSYLKDKNKKEYLYSHLAISNSVLTFSPSMFLIERFSEFKNKIIYLNHGVDIMKFSPLKKDTSEIKLLCVSKNILVDNVFDNKGYVLSDKIAKKLGLEITYVGDNQDFFDSIDYKFSGSKICRNVHKEELIKEFYGKNHILLHMSKFESGQPCLSILEALSSGLPVVATSMDNISLPGVEFINADVESGVEAVSKIINNYTSYRNSAIKTAHKLSWTNIVRNICIQYDDYINSKYKIIKRVLSNDDLHIYEDGGLLKIKQVFNEQNTYNIKFMDIDYNLLHENNLSVGVWAGLWIDKNETIFIEIKRDDYTEPYVFRYDVK